MSSDGTPEPTAPVVTSGGAEAADEAAWQLLGRDELASAWRDVELAPGEVLFHEGDDGDAFYMLVAGKLKVYAEARPGESLTLAYLEPVRLVGELAPIDGGTRTASVVAVEPSRLRALRRDDFLAELAHSPELGVETVKVVGRRMRRTVGYVRAMTDWAELIAEGRYEDARARIRADSEAAADPNIGHFVDAFVEMVSEIREREKKLARQVVNLKIEIDEEKRQREVLELVNTELFADLQKLRGRLSGVEE